MVFFLTHRSLCTCVGLFSHIYSVCNWGLVEITKRVVFIDRFCWCQWLLCLHTWVRVSSRVFRSVCLVGGFCSAVSARSKRTRGERDESIRDD